MGHHCVDNTMNRQLQLSRMLQVKRRQQVPQPSWLLAVYVGSLPPADSCCSNEHFGLITAAGAALALFCASVTAACSAGWYMAAAGASYHRAW
jgi:hypothetical protein